jgi:hypothetical protein
VARRVAQRSRRERPDCGAHGPHLDLGYRAIDFHRVLDEERNGAARDRVTREAVTISDVAGNARKQRTRPHFTAIGHDGRDVDIGPTADDHVGPVEEVVQQHARSY